jgi:hypothetical protein
MGEKWSDIIGWFVTIKCWIIVVYSHAWVSWNCNHEEEEIMTIIGPFIDGISWRNCREIISLRIQRGCCYFDLEYELCRSSKVSRRKRRNEIHWMKDRRRRPEGGGEWDPIKITHRNLVYIPNLKIGQFLSLGKNLQVLGLGKNGQVLVSGTNGQVFSLGTNGQVNRILKTLAWE